MSGADTGDREMELVAKLMLEELELLAEDEEEEGEDEVEWLDLRLSTELGLGLCRSRLNQPAIVGSTLLSHQLPPGHLSCYWLSPLEIHTCSKRGRERMGRRNPHSHQWGKDPVEGRSGNQLGSPGMDWVLANQRQLG